MIDKKEAIISIDVETSGGAVGKYSIVSIGACLVGLGEDIIKDADRQFYVELRPINDNFLERAMAKNRLDFEKLKITGTEPQLAMKKFEEWVGKVSEGRRPVFASWGTFDWGHIKYYLAMFGNERLFGGSSLDIKSYAAGVFGANSWNDAAKRHIIKDIGVKIPHTHNALSDAIEQALILERCIDARTEISESGGATRTDYDNPRRINIDDIAGLRRHREQARRNKRDANRVV